MKIDIDNNVLNIEIKNNSIITKAFYSDGSIILFFKDGESLSIPIEKLVKSYKSI